MPGRKPLCQVENISRKEHPHRDLSTTLRFGRDDKGKGGASRENSCWTEAGFISRAVVLARVSRNLHPATELSAKRSGEIRGLPVRNLYWRTATTLPFVISTAAYPDFLLRAASYVHVYGSPQREPYADPHRPGSRQEIRGSEVERSAVQQSFLEMFFDTGLAPALKESKLSAVCYMEQPLRLFHRPRVKSGNFTGALPCASEVLLSGVGDDHAAPSYTSISGGSPSCMHCNKR
jgi:hypothetical protein